MEKHRDPAKEQAAAEVTTCILRMCTRWMLDRLD